MTTDFRCPCCGSTVEGRQVTVDLSENVLRFEGKSVLLPNRRAEIAHVLARRMPETVAVDAIISQVWGINEGTSADSNLKSMVWFLRRDLKPLGIEIVSTRNRGYRMALLPKLLRTERSSTEAARAQA